MEHPANRIIAKPADLSLFAGFLTESGTSAGKSFSSAQAMLGYAAMAAVLRALQKAGSGATDRGTIRDAFFGLKGAPLLVGSGGPELGTYTVNKDGTVTITPASSH